MSDTDPLALLKAAQQRAARLAEPTAAAPPSAPPPPAPPPSVTPSAPPSDPVLAGLVGDEDGAEPTATVTRTVPGPVGATEPETAADGPVGVAVDELDSAASDGHGERHGTGERLRHRKRQSTTRNAIEWLVVIIGALVVALVLRTWLFQAFYIPSGSMEPTLHIDDRVLVNKVSYDLEDVDRGDIVVFERPADWGTGEIDDLIKRVVGLPGETISVVDGQVLINGAPLDEPWLADAVETPGFFPESGCVPQCTIPDDSVFVLGDNRGNSDASNHFGPLPFEQVVGRAFLRVWPIGDFGTL